MLVDWICFQAQESWFLLLGFWHLQNKLIEVLGCSFFLGTLKTKYIYLLTFIVFFPPWVDFHKLLDAKCSVSSFHYFRLKHGVGTDFQNLFQVSFLVSSSQELQENCCAPSNHPEVQNSGTHSLLKAEGLKPWSKQWPCTDAPDPYKKMASISIDEFINLIQLDFYKGGKNIACII